LQARTQLELARVLDLSSRGSTHPERRQLRESAAAIATDLDAPGLTALL